MGILGILTPLLYDSTENSKGSVVEIEKNWKIDTLNWHFLKFKCMIAKAMKDKGW
jgi:hypothetical protein